MLLRLNYKSYLDINIKDTQRIQAKELAGNIIFHEARLLLPQSQYRGNELWDEKIEELVKKYIDAIMGEKKLHMVEKTGMVNVMVVELLDAIKNGDQQVAPILQNILDEIDNQWNTIAELDKQQVTLHISKSKDSLLKLLKKFD